MSVNKSLVAYRVTFDNIYPVTWRNTGHVMSNYGLYHYGWYEMRLSLANAHLYKQLSKKLFKKI